MDNNHEVIGVFWRAFLGFCKLISSGKNGHHFADDTFERIFLNEIIWISNKISLKYYLGYNWQIYVSIDSDNGLAPSRWQTIIWTNADPVQ